MLRNPAIFQSIRIINPHLRPFAFREHRQQQFFGDLDAKVVVFVGEEPGRLEGMFVPGEVGDDDHSRSDTNPTDTTPPVRYGASRSFKVLVSHGPLVVADSTPSCTVVTSRI